MDFLECQKKTFPRGGVHFTDDGKSRTTAKPIERFVPKEVVIPLQQHLGPPAKSKVKRKEKVKRGDVIGEAPADGASIHASVSGTVKQITLLPHPILVEAEAVVIETDPNAEEPVWEENRDWRNLSPDILLEKIAVAGIVGLGGAAFPTHRKLRTAREMGVDLFILNGSECEPILTSDERLMEERPKDILWGACLLAKIAGAKKILIGIEDNKKIAANVLRTALLKENFGVPIEIVLCKTRYPQGSEKQLVEALTGRGVPFRKLPLHMGILVQNVATALAVFEAVCYNKPLLDRVVTVSGSGILHPKNLSVPIGTRIDAIIDFCGGLHEKTAKVIAGGPMMGKALGRLDVPVIKGMGGLLFLREEEVRAGVYGPCISCGRCLEACPIGLEPNQISIYTEAGKSLETEEFGTKDCIECGCCAVVCPATRPLVQFIQMAKLSFKTGSSLGLGVWSGGE